MRRMKAATQADMIRVLEQPVWPDGLEARMPYSRLHDDHDGTQEGRLNVVFSEDGDAWVSTTGRRPMESLRFRTHQGGGGSVRVRNALLLLALAIKMDGEGPL